MSRSRPILWPVSALNDAMVALAQRSGIALQAGRRSASVDPLIDASDAALGHWIEDLAAQSDMEAEPISTPYGDVAEFLAKAGPAIVRLSRGKNVASTRFMVVLKGGGKHISVLGTDLKAYRVRANAVCTALRLPIEASVGVETDRLLDEAGVSRRRRAHARSAILRERLRGVTLTGFWMLRIPPGGSFWTQMRHVGLPRRFAVFLGLHALQYAIYIISWAVLGWAVFKERIEPGWLMAWALLLLTVVPLRMVEARWQSLLSIDIGTLLKQRLLYGALRLEPEEIKHQGIGQLLGSVLESDAVENLALTGALVDCVGLLELIVAGAVLAVGAGGPIHMALLVAWSVFAGYLAWRYYRNRRDWTTERLEMTHDIVEQMVGHRTRLAQEEPTRWHDDEDRMLPRYLEFSKRADRSLLLLNAAVARGWLIVGLLGLAPAFITGSDEAPIALAISLGGVLLAYRALTRIGGGLGNIAGALVAAERAANLFRAASRPIIRGAPSSLLATSTAGARADKRATVVEASQIVFRYQDRGDPVLQNCSLRIRKGDRILLEGPSGGGKSTLVSLLTGLRTPESGLLLLHGLDRNTVGAHRWRQQIVAAPQFHDNYIVTETFAFNLLMGRGWPPQESDFVDAEAICRELGLDKLIERMPSGLLQIVGETGWQLSHGEKSRLYMARALLQKSDLVILDESFAALDPETLQQAMKCALERAGTLVLVAHP